MAVYYLARNITAVTLVPPAAVPISAQFGGPVGSVSIQGIASGSATLQPMGSNDGVNWVAQGSTIAVPGSASQGSGTNSTGGASITASWAFWGVGITVISGTVTVTISG